MTFSASPFELAYASIALDRSGDNGPRQTVRQNPMDWIRSYASNMFGNRDHPNRPSIPVPGGGFTKTEIATAASQAIDDFRKASRIVPAMLRKISAQLSLGDSSSERFDTSSPDFLGGMYYGLMVSSPEKIANYRGKVQTPGNLANTRSFLNSEAARFEHWCNDMISAFVQIAKG